WAIGSSDIRHKTQRNAMTSPYLWLLSSFAVIPAVLFWQNEYLLMFFVAVFSATYIILYRRLVLFRMPKWLVIKKRGKKHRRGIKGK
ncbi:MAG: glycosyl transferase, partial [Achromobacter piechaudii]